MSMPKRKRKNRQSVGKGTDEVPRLPKTKPLQLRYYGDPILRKRAEPVETITDVELKFSEEMLMTLEATQGIGLAATQVGVLKQLLVVDLSANQDEIFEPMVLFNPEILYVEGEIVAEEGCLSIPDLRADVKRHEKIIVKAMGLDSQDYEIEADGLLARVLQHEIDHLNGTLFIDRISGLKKQFLRSELHRIQQADRPI